MNSAIMLFTHMKKQIPNIIKREEDKNEADFIFYISSNIIERVWRFKNESCKLESL